MRKHFQPQSGYVKVCDGPYKGRIGRVLEVIEQEPKPIEGGFEHQLPLVRIRDEKGIFIVRVNILAECFMSYLGEQAHPIDGLVEWAWSADDVGRYLFEREQPPPGFIDVEVGMVEHEFFERGHVLRVARELLH